MRTREAPDIKLNADGIRAALKEGVRRAAPSCEQFHRDVNKGEMVLEIGDTSIFKA